MIAIINQGKRDNKNRTLYHVKINHVFICEFWHERSDGLAECLLKASKAVYVKYVQERFGLL